MIFIKSSHGNMIILDFNWDFRYRIQPYSQGKTMLLFEGKKNNLRWDCKQKVFCWLHSAAWCLGVVPKRAPEMRRWDVPCGGMKALWYAKLAQVTFINTGRRILARNLRFRKKREFWIARLKKCRWVKILRGSPAWPSTHLLSQGVSQTNEKPDPNLSSPFVADYLSTAQKSTTWHS